MSGTLPPRIERNPNARALLPSHRPLLEFFASALADFRASDAPFAVVCTLAAPAAAGPAQLLQHRIVSARPGAVRPRTPPRRLAVLDSSFNPPTRAHLAMAMAAGVGADADARLLLVLGVSNADKAAALPAPLPQRLAMMWALAHDLREAGAAAPIDVCLSAGPYFHEKSEAIARDGFYGGVEGGGPEQVFLVGYDTLIRIFNPKYYGDSRPDGEEGAVGTGMQRALRPFLARARLLVTIRADAEWGSRDEQLAHVEDLLRGDGLEKVGGDREWARRIDIAEGRGEKEPIVSSTLARDAARNQDKARLEELVSRGVRRWMEEGKFYREDL